MVVSNKAPTSLQGRLKIRIKTLMTATSSQDSRRIILELMLHLAWLLLLLSLERLKLYLCTAQQYAGFLFILFQKQVFGLSGDFVGKPRDTLDTCERIETIASNSIGGRRSIKQRQLHLEPWK